MAANLARLEAAAWPIFAAGHIPMIGEWVALPVLRSAGVGTATVPSPARDVSDRPATARTLRCFAAAPEETTGADADVAIARERGLPVWYRIEDVPGYRPNSALGLTAQRST